MGEIIAAHVAGVLDRTAALDLLLRRARITERGARGGAMAGIQLPVEQVEPLLAAAEGRLEIAAVNGPRSVVVSGDRPAVEHAAATAAEAGAKTRVLPVEYAFHSPLLAGCDDELAAAIADLRAREGTIALYSTVTGGRVDAAALDGAHWGRNLRERVRFDPAIAAMAADGVSTFIEVGPHPVLLRDLGERLEEDGVTAVAVGSLRGDRPAAESLYRSLADLYRTGADIDWSAVMAPPRHHVALPAYPWQRRRHWLPPASAGAPAAFGVPGPATGPAAAGRADPAREPDQPGEPADPGGAPSAAHVEALIRYVRERIIHAMGGDADVPPDVPLTSLGLNSMVVVELKNQVERDFGVTVPLRTMLQSGTPSELGQAIAGIVPATGATGGTDTSDTDTRDADGGETRSPDGER
jgi:acyl transferase domain-containing protein